MKTDLRALYAMALSVFFPVPVSIAQFQTALPGYHYEFPRDYFNHPDFQTEWWYYTGNVQSADGHKFGFELTFFRQGLSRDPKQNSPWNLATSISRISRSAISRAKSSSTRNVPIALARASRALAPLCKKFGMETGVWCGWPAKNAFLHWPILSF